MNQCVMSDPSTVGHLDGSLTDVTLFEGEVLSEGVGEVTEEVELGCEEGWVPSESSARCTLLRSSGKRVSIQC